MTPDADNYYPDPDYIHDLVDRIDLPRPKIAAALGVTDKTIRNWMNGSRAIPYTAQFCLECLAGEA